MRNKEAVFARHDIVRKESIKVNANDNFVQAANDNFAAEAIAKAA